MEHALTARPRGHVQPPKYRQRFAGVPEADCPPELQRQIDVDLAKIAKLASLGLWTHATRTFHELREKALKQQRCTLDPHDVAIADTTIDSRTAGQLAEIGVTNVGQLGNVPRSELKRAGIGPKLMQRLQTIAGRYGVRLRGR